MTNLLKNIWNAVKTLLAALKQKFLTHPTEVVEAEVAKDEAAAKTDVEVAVAKVEAVPAVVATDVAHTAEEVAADVPKAV